MFEFFFKYPSAVYSRGHFQLLAPAPVWVLILLAAAAGGFLYWHVRRNHGLLSRTRSLAIWGLQTAMVGLILLLLWHPAVSVATLRPQQNIVAVLLDSSRSMTMRDGSESRFQQASNLLQGGLLDSLGNRFQVRTYRFGADAQRVERKQLLGAPDQNVTRIGRSLTSIAAESASLPFGAVVMLTDGAENLGGIDYETVQKLRQSRIPVHTVGFGRERLNHDVEIEEFSVPQKALPGSRIEARVVLRQSGYSGDKARVTIRDGGTVLASQDVELGREEQAVGLVLTASRAGALNLTARVDPMPGEENAANNAVARLVDVTERRPRILYVEGEPRWEYKFLRRAADADTTVELVSMLRTTPNKIYRQGVKDASELADGFPTKPEDLFAYDGLIIGSVEANWFTPVQQQMIRDFAARRGGGVLFLGGRFALSDSGYGTTPIAEMLPVRLPSRTGTFDRTYSTASLTPAGVESALCRLIDNSAQNVEKWKKMPQIANWQLVGEPKPGAAVLAEVAAPGHRPTPLLATEPYGRGRTAVLATAGMWRWQMRSDHNDHTLAVFWQQMLRWLVSETPGPVSATTPRQILADEDLVKFRVEVRNKAYEPLSSANVEAHVIGPNSLSDTVRLMPVASETGVYTAEWTAPQPGSYIAEVTATAPNESPQRDVVTFRREDGVAEAFRTTQNRELLEKLSKETGGRYFTARDARRLADEISYSESGINTRETLDLWDVPIVLLLALMLRGSEWLLRRRWGVV